MESSTQVFIAENVELNRGFIAYWMYTIPSWLSFAVLLISLPFLNYQPVSFWAVLFLIVGSLYSLAYGLKIVLIYANYKTASSPLVKAHMSWLIHTFWWSVGLFCFCLLWVGGLFGYHWTDTIGNTLDLFAYTACFGLVAFMFLTIRAAIGLYAYSKKEFPSKRYQKKFGGV